MRFNLDENLHEEVAEALRTRGHDAQTVFDEGLRGHPDLEIAEAARCEGRVIVTLDLDFGTIRDFPPESYRGLIVLRLTNQSRPHVSRVMDRVVDQLASVPLDGHLWVVTEGGIRVRPGEAKSEEP